MSLRILKAGIFDAVQDIGRYGHQHLGINPGGAMDRFSAQLANALLGKELSAAVIEFHFPASEILFEKQTIMCICGADFSASINNHEVPLCQPFVVASNSLLKFRHNKSGARAYLALLHNFQLKPWLNSYSTNVKAAAGGYDGRRLKKGDELFYNNNSFQFSWSTNSFHLLPWRASEPMQHSTEISFIPGNEWDWLTTDSQRDFFNGIFTITNAADRMGYRLDGVPLQTKTNEQLVSSAVSYGTIQLLPNGQLIVLMADHQTTGGYPRIAYVTSADLPKLAQTTAGKQIKFVITDLQTAEENLVQQQRYLQQLQTTCKLKMQNFLHDKS